MKGNHESYLGPGGDKVPRATTERYLNQTWGVVYGQETDTATTALGSLLTKGTYYGVGSHGSSPSGTSRYNSVDIGLFHIVGLDLDPGSSPGSEGTWALWNSTEGPGGRSAQGLWLEQDLAAADANRDKVLWVIDTSNPDPGPNNSIPNPNPNPEKSPNPNPDPKVPWVIVMCHPNPNSKPNSNPDSNPKDFVSSSCLTLTLTLTLSC